MPKGVMLTHENVVASMCSVIMQLGEHKPAKNDVLISFLPLAHMLERCCEVRSYFRFILVSKRCLNLGHLNNTSKAVGNI